MFENVLVGVDGGPGGRDAIALARQLVAPEAKLTLVHVYHSIVYPSLGYTVIADRREDATKLLEAERAKATVQAGLVAVEIGGAGAGLHRQSEELGADLLVVGSSRRSGFGRAMLGDDTRAALNGAPCAVAIARAGYADQPSPIVKIGVGYDESPESEAALLTARELAARTQASVDALRVVSLVGYGYAGLMPPLTGEGVAEVLQQAEGRMKGLSDINGYEVLYGLPGEALAELSEKEDLLIVGSRGYGPIKRLVLGSTSNYLQRHARCSLLVLPRTAHQPHDPSAADANTADTAMSAIS